LPTALLVLWTSGAQASQDVLVAPTTASLKVQVDAWIGPKLTANPELKEIVNQLWAFGERTPTASDRSEALLRTLYIADPDVRELIESCRLAGGVSLNREFRALTSHGDEPLLSHNVRAFYARFLATATLYDEALAVYREVDPAHLADPASALFYKAVCQHALLLRDEGLDTLSRLLDSTADVPSRYRAVAMLMQTDLEALKEKSLGEVARQMSDVRRRLALGRAGEKVQRVEDQIVVTLDEIIKQKESQCQQCQSPKGGSQNSGQAQPNKPAQDTYLGGIKGQGLSEKKDIGRGDKWGQLPDKAQAAAKGMLERDFPGHYRLAVEQYLKRLAERTAPPRE
jgi:hypothetical protein